MRAGNQPNWGGKFDWKWFQFHHFKKLESAYLKIEELKDELKIGQKLNRQERKILLKALDEIISLHPYLPDTGGGQDSTKSLHKKTNRLKLSSLIIPVSFSRLSEIKSDVFGIYNYMRAMCSDDSY